MSLLGSREKTRKLTGEPDGPHVYVVGAQHAPVLHQVRVHDGLGLQTHVHLVLVVDQHKTGHDAPRSETHHPDQGYLIANILIENMMAAHLSGEHLIFFSFQFSEILLLS